MVRKGFAGVNVIARNILPPPLLRKNGARARIHASQLEGVVPRHIKLQRMFDDRLLVAKTMGIVGRHADAPTAVKVKHRRMELRRRKRTVVLLT